MTPDFWLQQLHLHRAIAVIRAPDFQLGLAMARSVAAGGLKLIEITWDSPQAAKIIQTLRQELTDCTIGTGTVLTVADLTGAIDAGAEFVFSPFAHPALITTAAGMGVPIVPGALTPTEIVTAWQAGATCVKVFPVSALGGASYLKSLREPLHGIPLIPTGGVTPANARSMLDAGAIAVGLSSSLFPKQAIVTGDWAQVKSIVEDLQQQLRQEHPLENQPGWR